MPSPNSSEEEELKMKGSLPDMEVSGAIEFKMDKKSYRMIPLAKSEDYLYNKQSLRRAREVSVVCVCVCVCVCVSVYSYCLCIHAYACQCVCVCGQIPQVVLLHNPYCAHVEHAHSLV